MCCSFSSGQSYEHIRNTKIIKDYKNGIHATRLIECKVNNFLISQGFLENGSS